MFVRAVVHSRIAGAGKIVDPDLVGKWISPMHPEVVKDGPGKCDVCGMPLVRAEELGFISIDKAGKETPLTIPASAPLITGKRAVVYVAVAGQNGVYEGREIELGPRAGDFYLVKSGLEEGERVVVKGNFKIDSAIQIKAGPSMMNPEGGGSTPGHQHGQSEIRKSTTVSSERETSGEEEIKRYSNISQDFLKQLDVVYTTYFEIQYALSHDDFDGSKEKSVSLLKILEKVNMDLLKGDSHMQWMEVLEELKKSGNQIKFSDNIETARKAFDGLSQAIINAAKSFGSKDHSLLVYHCPMAFNRGADWLQNKQGTENPYFGSAMFQCGDQTADLTSMTKTENHGEHKHE
jgi:Cu(I)/Ag(I) efflux system membrane fusion protein